MHKPQPTPIDTLKAHIASIQKSMTLADLQVKVMNFKMSEVTPESIDTLFEGFEGDDTAQKLAYNITSIARLKNKLDNQPWYYEDLTEKLIGFKPKGPFILVPTPVAIDIIFYNIRDWYQFKGKKNIVTIIRHHIFTIGFSSMADVQLSEGENVHIPINCYNPAHPPFEGIIKHESRHALNKALGLRENYVNIPDCDTKKEIINKIIERAMKYLLGGLKDELSAYIEGSQSNKLQLKIWTFRSRYLFGLYDFKHMPDDFWDCMKEEYNLDDDDIESMKKEVIKRMKVFCITDNAYAAVKLLQQKGYSREWAVSFLCTEDNFMKDWLECAKACPTKSNG